MRFTLGGWLFAFAGGPVFLPRGVGPATDDVAARAYPLEPITAGWEFPKAPATSQTGGAGVGILTRLRSSTTSSTLALRTPASCHGEGVPPPASGGWAIVWIFAIERRKP